LTKVTACEEKGAYYLYVNPEGKKGVGGRPETEERGEYLLQPEDKVKAVDWLEKKPHQLEAGVGER